MIEDQNLGRFAEKKFNLLAPPTYEKRKRVSSEDNGRRLCQSDHLGSDIKYIRQPYYTRGHKRLRSKKLQLRSIKQDDKTFSICLWLLQIFIKSLTRLRFENVCFYRPKFSETSKICGGLLSQDLI